MAVSREGERPWRVLSLFKACWGDTELPRRRRKRNKHFRHMSEPHLTGQRGSGPAQRVLSRLVQLSGLGVLERHGSVNISHWTCSCFIGGIDFVLADFFVHRFPFGIHVAFWYFVVFSWVGSSTSSGRVVFTSREWPWRHDTRGRGWHHGLVLYSFVDSLCRVSFEAVAGSTTF